MIETENDMAVNQEMMANNYFSADVQSSQYSLNNYNSSSKIKDRKELIQEQHVPKLFNKKSVNLLEQNWKRSSGLGPKRSITRKL